MATLAFSPPPPPPTRPTSQRPTPPILPSPPSRHVGDSYAPVRPIELIWLTWQVSDALREQTKASAAFRARWRAQECGPLLPPTAR